MNKGIIAAALLTIVSVGVQASDWQFASADAVSRCKGDKVCVEKAEMQLYDVQSVEELERLVPQLEEAVNWDFLIVEKLISRFNTDNSMLTVYIKDGVLFYDTGVPDSILKAAGWDWKKVVSGTTVTVKDGKRYRLVKVAKGRHVLIGITEISPVAKS